MGHALIRNQDGISSGGGFEVGNGGLLGVVGDGANCKLEA